MLKVYLISDIQSPQVEGINVVFSASLSGENSSGYEYQYLIRGTVSGGEWEIVQNYSQKPIYTWDTKKYEGTNEICVYVRETGSQKAFQSYHMVKFDIYTSQTEIEQYESGDYFRKSFEKKLSSKTSPVTKSTENLLDKSPMEDKEQYKKILDFYKRTEDEANSHLQELMPKWIQCCGDSEYYACAIALSHIKLNNLIEAKNILIEYVGKHKGKLLSQCLLAEIYYKTNKIDNAIELYEKVIGEYYSDGEIIKNYLWCLHRKSFDLKLDISTRQKIGSKFLEVVNHILKEHVYDIGVENLHYNVHIATKIIRDTQNDAISRGIPPVVLMSPGCSASTATLSMLSQRLGTGGIALQNQLNSFDLIIEAVKIFSKGGLITRLQSSFSHGNVQEALLENGMKKIVCTIRDPRECLVSHQRMMLQFQCISDPEAILSVLNPRNGMVQFKTFLEIVFSYDKEAISTESKFKIFLLDFREFKSDPITYIKKIVDFYNIPDSACLTPYNQLSSNRKQNVSNRHAIKTDWQRLISVEMAKEMDNSIPPELLEYFRWPARLFNL